MSRDPYKRCDWRFISLTDRSAMMKIMIILICFGKPQKHYLFNGRVPSSSLMAVGTFILIQKSSISRLNGTAIKKITFLTASLLIYDYDILRLVICLISSVGR